MYMRNKQICWKLFSIILLFLCCGCSTPTREGLDTINYTYSVSFPEKPIQVMSVSDPNAFEYILNYFNIVKVSDSMYYLYYSAFTKDVDASDEFTQGLFFAYSTDGIHYKRHFPTGGSEGNRIIETGIKEQSVFIDENDTKYPFKLIGNIREEGKALMCIWKSTDGISFSDRKVVMDDFLHDTQQVVIPRTEGGYTLYTRLWKERDRRIAVGSLDQNLKLIAPLDTLDAPFVYNSAASYLDERYDLLLPTYMDNYYIEPRTDDCYFKAFLVDKRKPTETIEIECELEKWIKDDEKWRIVSPGLINIKGEQYVSYYTVPWSHDGVLLPEGGGRFFLAKVKIEKVLLKDEENN